MFNIYNKIIWARRSNIRMVTHHYLATGVMSTCRYLCKDSSRVYKPKERPWIQIENATTAELIAQINQCPSGALTYRMNKEVK